MEEAKRNVDVKETARLEAIQLKQEETIARIAAEKKAQKAEQERVKAFRVAVEKNAALES